MWNRRDLGRKSANELYKLPLAPGPPPYSNEPPPPYEDVLIGNQPQENQMSSNRYPPVSPKPKSSAPPKPVMPPHNLRLPPRTHSQNLLDDSFADDLLGVKDTTALPPPLLPLPGSTSASGDYSRTAHNSASSMHQMYGGMQQVQAGIDANKVSRGSQQIASGIDVNKVASGIDGRQVGSGLDQVTGGITFQPNSRGNVCVSVHNAGQVASGLGRITKGINFRQVASGIDAKKVAAGSQQIASGVDASKVYGGVQQMNAGYSGLRSGPPPLPPNKPTFSGQSFDQNNSIIVQHNLQKPSIPKKPTYRQSPPVSSFDADSGIDTDGQSPPPKREATEHRDWVKFSTSPERPVPAHRQSTFQNRLSMFENVGPIKPAPYQSQNSMHGSLEDVSHDAPVRAPKPAARQKQASGERRGSLPEVTLHPQNSVKKKAPRPPMPKQRPTILRTKSAARNHSKRKPPPRPPSTYLKRKDSTRSTSSSGSSDKSSTELSSKSVLSSLSSPRQAFGVSDHVTRKALTQPTDPHCIALYDFKADHSDELEFQIDDVIILVKSVNDDWFYGKKGNATGIFPKSHAKVIVPLAEDAEQSKTWQTETQHSTDKSVKALYDFQGEPGELSFKSGSTIEVTARINDDWLVGKVQGVTGRFPANFISHVPPNLPVERDSVDTWSATAVKEEVPGSPLFAVALFDFDAASHSEISLRRGNKITILGSVNDDWLHGRVDGQGEGAFPANFVQILDNYAPRTQTKKKTVCVRAIYDFHSGVEGDLSFKMGDTIEVTENVNDSWLKGICHGKTGIFPTAYVQVDGKT